MTFSIQMADKVVRRDGEEFLVGSIAVDAWSEDFHSPFWYWTGPQYERQWKEGVDKALRGETSALVTSIRDPERFSFITWWILAPQGNSIIMSNQLLHLPSLPRPFDERNLYASIRARDLEDSDSARVSRWTFRRSDLIDYRDRAANLP